MNEAVITPYLFFGGRCQEALDYYSDALGAEIGETMLFSQSPVPISEGFLEPGFESKVMHGSFKLAGAEVFVSDGYKSGGSFDGFVLTLTLKSSEVATRLFNALAEDGSVQMPLTPTFYSPLFGMVTDRFGLGWMIMLNP